MGLSLLLSTNNIVIHRYSPLPYILLLDMCIMAL